MALTVDQPTVTAILQIGGTKYDFGEKVKN